MANTLSQRIEQARNQLHAAAGCTATDCSRRLQGKNQRHTGSLAGSRRGSVSSTAQVVQLSALQYSRPYRTLAEAEKVMEHDELARLAVVTFTRQLFLPNLKVDLFERSTLWSHSMSVAAVASMISRSSGSGDPD